MTVSDPFSDTVAPHTAAQVSSLREYVVAYPSPSAADEAACALSAGCKMPQNNNRALMNPASFF